MKVLVTGGGGFLGRGIVAALRERGDDVRSLARSEYPELAKLGVEPIRGDIADAEAVAAAVEGCDLVFHVAARVGAAGDYDEFHATNVVGTQNIIDACRKHGVSKLVYTSTPSVVFGHDDLEGVDESAPYATDYEAFYPQTKAEAERLVLAASGDGLHTVSIRPHIVWGPGDTSLLPRLLERAPRLRRIRGPAKKTDVTFIDDAVRAHVLAADRLGEEPDAVSGKAYFVSTGEPIEIWTFIDRVLQAAGRPTITKTAPAGLALAAGWVFEKIHAMTGASGEPRLSRWIVRELTRSHWFDISAARRDLGYQPTVTIDEGMRRLTQWVQDGGLPS
ncbi:MAG: NAD-dependent epimerase/dehydratase family protein [Myxococcota bacterium]